MFYKNIVLAKRRDLIKRVDARFFQKQGMLKRGIKYKGRRDRTALHAVRLAYLRVGQIKNEFLILLVCREFPHIFIVLHQAHSCILVSIQRYFGVVINYHALIVFYIDKLPL